MSAGIGEIPEGFRETVSKDCKVETYRLMAECPTRPKNETCRRIFAKLKRFEISTHIGKRFE